MDSIVALVAASFTIICALCGSVWWMSALYSRVRSIHERVDEFVLDHKDSQTRLWNKVEEIDGQLDGLNIRLTTIETRLE